MLTWYTLPTVLSVRVCVRASFVRAFFSECFPSMRACLPLAAVLLYACTCAHSCAARSCTHRVRRYIHRAMCAAVGVHARAREPDCVRAHSHVCACVRAPVPYSMQRRLKQQYNRYILSSVSVSCVQNMEEEHKKLQISYYALEDLYERWTPKFRTYEEIEREL